MLNGEGPIIDKLVFGDNNSGRVRSSLAFSSCPIPPECFFFLSLSLYISLFFAIISAISNLIKAQSQPLPVFQLATWDSDRGLNGSLRENRAEHGMQGVTLKVVTLLVRIPVYLNQLPIGSINVLLVSRDCTITVNKKHDMIFIQ